MRRSFAIIFTMLFVIGLAAPAFAGGPAEKATGSGYWTGDTAYYGEFNAHEAKDGRPAKGWLLQVRVDGRGGFIVDVTDVVVDTQSKGDYGCFGGTVVQAWGVNAGLLGVYRYAFARDGGEPGLGVDGFKGNSWPNLPSNCTSGGYQPSQLKPLTGGNFQVHLSE